MNTKSTFSRFVVAAVLVLLSLQGAAQGWPSAYGGVMLQGFYWDSFGDTNWAKLESQAEDMSGYIDLLWIPNAGNCGSGNQMGYAPQYWFSNYSSSFGTKAQLQSMVSTMSAKGIGIIGDVVINHRNTTNGWFGFPSETYGGQTYQLTSTDIVADDDNRQAAYVASQQGVTLSSNNDTGDGWNGMRDLDHMSSNVQRCVKAYLNMLLNDLHYVGFRYDMVAGFSASYIGTYNSYAQPQFSVGECWKSGSEIKSWIDGTKVNNTPTSAAFDFQFRYTVRNAINNRNWSKLSDANDGYPLISNSFNSGSYKQWSVTFVENHDTQYRDANNPNDPISADTIAANAYMLAMPGTPCVFLRHWQDYKAEIKNLIAARKAAGVSNTSAYSVTSNNSNRYVTTTTGTKTKLICAVGSNVASYAGPSNSVQILSGYHYKYFMPSSANIAWVDMPSGNYGEAFDVKLTAVSSSYTTLVYTTDGSTPSASNGTRVASGTSIHVDGNMTLKVGLLNGNSIVSGSTLERTYKVVETKKITVYLKDPGWSTVYFYAYGFNDGTSNDSWPGTMVNRTKTVKGETFYYRTFESTNNNLSFNIIFDNGNSGNDNQTVNITGITQDVYYEITGGGGTSKLTVTDVTDYYTTPVEPLTATVYFQDPGWSDVYYYSWDGNNNLSLGSWPGTKITATTVVDGKTYYYHTFDKSDENYSFNLVISNNAGTQTVDITGITSDVYYKLGPIDSATGKYTVVDPADDVEEFVPYNVSVYLKDPGWANGVKCHAWGTGTVKNPDNSSLSDNWPGGATSTVIIDGETWYYRTFTIAAEGSRVNVVFNDNNNGTQTVDITGIAEDTYYELGGMSGNKYEVVNDGNLTETITGVALDQETVRLQPGGSCTLQVTVSGTNVRSPVVWTSSDESVATVTNGAVSPVASNARRRSQAVGGEITAVGNGTATITASVGEFSASCELVVSEITGLESLPAGATKVYVSGGLLVIDSPAATTAMIITPDGRSRRVVVKPGENTYELHSPLTIVNIDGRAVKLAR